jgi:glycosyltransferase involved in cell wall biosynthesis
MRVLFISSDKFPPTRVDVSVLFGKELVGRGHIIDWLLQSEKPSYRAYETRWFGGKVLVGRTFSGKSFSSALKRHLYSILHDLQIFSLLRDSRYDFVILKDKFISGLFSVIAAKLYKVKMIYWLSYPFPEASFFRIQDGTATYPVLYWLRGHIFEFLLYKLLLPFSHHVFVQTEHMLNNIAGKGIPKQKMTSVPMAVSVNEIPYFGYKINKCSKVSMKTVVYLGTLWKTRKMDFLLRSFEKVLKTNPQTRLYLIGGSEDPSDERFLEAEARRLKVDHAVTITGYLPQSEAWHYVENADLCVSPIYPTPILDCGSPTKLIEYMAMGKAVVANNHPEQSSVISESKAGICVPYDEDAFANAINYLLAHPGLSRKMGNRGREYVQRKRNYQQAASLVEKTLRTLLLSRTNF